MNIIPVTDGEI